MSVELINPEYVEISSAGWNSQMMRLMRDRIGAEFGYPAPIAADAVEVTAFKETNPDRYNTLAYSARVFLVQQGFVPPVYSPAIHPEPQEAIIMPDDAAVHYDLAAGPQ